MTTYTSNSVKHNDQWTVKRQGNSTLAGIKVFFINVAVLVSAIATAYALLH